MRWVSCYLVVGLLCLLTASASAQQVNVMQWNVERNLGRLANNTNAQAKAIASIVNYNQPDILLFNEIDASGLNATANQNALIDWVTNNVPYLGTLPGVTFFVVASTKSDFVLRNAVISRFPILTEGTYNTNTVSLRGLHSFKAQLSGTNGLQVFHAHFKCCGSGADSECQQRQDEATWASGTIRAWAGTNSLPYIFAGDWNEDESNPQCFITSTYRPITMVRTNGMLTEFIPTSLNGNSKTFSSANPNSRLDYCLAASNRLTAVTGHVFNSVIWGSQYTSVIPGSSTSDSQTGSDHLSVFVKYSFPTSATNFNVTPGTNFASGGLAGGPFSPPSQVYTLTNSDTIPLFWSVTKTSEWLTVTPPATSFTLGAGRSTNITVSVNSNANVLTPATYIDTINFSNTATGVSFPRGVTLTVGANPPTASFSGSPTNGIEPLEVTFTDTSVGNINNRFWDFGDGNTTNVTTNVVVHTYAAGIYDVTLLVSGVGGSDTNTKPSYVTSLTAFQAWQIQYFGSTTNGAAAAGADPDGDGQDNMAEFSSNTNPTNSASALQITAITREGNNIRLTWTTAGGKTNVVQGGIGQFDGFGQPVNPSYTNEFFDISDPIAIPGNGDAVTNWVDDGTWLGEYTNWPARYYRIWLVQ